MVIVFLKFQRHRVRKRMFPDQRRLLSDDEYRKEGVVETKKALKGLQQYCHSPESNPWRTVLKLKDPVRYSFVYEVLKLD
jgi:hypothetical protein